MAEANRSSQKRKTDWGCGWGVAFLSIIIATAVGCYYMADWTLGTGWKASETPHTTSAATPTPDPFEAHGKRFDVYNAKAAVQEKLNDPRSIEVLQFSEPMPIIFNDEALCWMAVIEYTAKNSFGGRVRDKALIVGRDGRADLVRSDAWNAMKLWDGTPLPPTLAE